MDSPFEAEITALKKEFAAKYPSLEAKQKQLTEFDSVKTSRYDLYYDKRILALNELIRKQKGLS